tara:strand:- start:349 stop:1560 length:1212 start_codon:yes stop_codon:yes gene_type:complete
MMAETLDLGELTEEERQMIARQRAIANMPSMPRVAPVQLDQYRIKPAENLGQGLRNFAQNVIIRPLGERLGLRESISDVLNRSRVVSELNDQRAAQAQFRRQEQLRAQLQALRPEQRDLISNLSADQLEQVAANLQSQASVGPLGGIAQENVLTGEMTSIVNPTTSNQELLMDRRLLAPLGPERRRIANQTKIDEAAFERIGQIEKETREGFANFAERSAAERAFAQIIADPSVNFGTGQEVINAFRGLGVNLAGAVDEGLSGAELFQSVFSALIAPRVKTLGRNPTDVDLAFVSQQAPQLSNTREGNALIIEFLQIATNRADMRQKLVSEFASKEGNMALKASNPPAYRLALENAIAAQERSPEYIGPNLFELKARAARLLGNDPEKGVDALVKGLTNGDKS